MKIFKQPCCNPHSQIPSLCMFHNLQMSTLWCSICWPTKKLVELDCHFWMDAISILLPIVSDRSPIHHKLSAAASSLLAGVLTSTIPQIFSIPQRGLTLDCRYSPYFVLLDTFTFWIDALWDCTGTGAWAKGRLGWRLWDRTGAGAWENRLDWRPKPNCALAHPNNRTRISKIYFL